MEELWREKTYNRLAIPEILESEKGGTSRSFADIKHDLDLGWPIKEKLFMSTGSRSTDIVQPYIGLTWCKSKYGLILLWFLLTLFSPGLNSWLLCPCQVSEAVVRRLGRRPCR